MLWASTSHITNDKDQHTGVSHKGNLPKEQRDNQNSLCSSYLLVKIKSYI